MNYTRFFNKLSLGRQPSPIRVLTGIVARSPPSLISMAGGMPNAETFPFDDATFTLKDGSKVQIDKSLMKTALQYSPTPGVPGFIKWIKTLQKEIHNPPLLDKTDHPGQTDVLITNGSQDGLCKAFEAMLSTDDNVLLESPTYSGTLAIVKPIMPNFIPIQSDKDGLDPSSLESALSKWKPNNQNITSNVPKLLYCVPNGGNPTGGGLTLDRKKRIYEIAREYDLIILEDDPYFYIQFNKPRVPSFLSMDTDGRVVRFDSFSKLLSSGMRIGFVTGPKPILDRIALHMQASVMHASSLSQVVMLQTLEKWGHDGFLDHTEKITDFYKQRREQCLKAIEKHLTGIAEWNVPTGGMFIWIKLLNVKDTFKLISVKAREKEVLFVPGNAFMLDDQAPCQYIRASYSLSTPEQMDLAFERLAALIKEE